MISIKIIYNSKSDPTFLKYKINPFFELINEEDPKQVKSAYKYKGAAAAKQTPFISIYEDNKLIKAFYSEDNSATVDNLMNYLDDYYSKSPSGWLTIEKIAGSEPLGVKYYGYTRALAEGIGCCVQDSPDSWYHTSIVTKIDWDKQEFKTLNSTYAFKFDDKRTNSGAN